MKEGSKKTFKKKNIEPIFRIVDEGAEIKKTFEKKTISRKVNESDVINKRFDLFQIKLRGGGQRKKQAN